MNLVVTVFAALSVVLTTAIFYYNMKIVGKFREDEELTATKLVIREQVPDAFMALSISSLFFSLGAFLGASVIILEAPIFSYFTELGVITMLTGLLTFMKRISDAVTQGKKIELEDEDTEETETGEAESGSEEDGEQKEEE